MSDEHRPFHDRPSSQADSPLQQDPEDEDFGAMLESSLEARSFEEGQPVVGVVVAIGGDIAFVDIGGKSEATIDIGELKDPEGDIEVEVGETIEAIVVSSAGGLKLSRKLARGVLEAAQVADAFHAGLPVEGRVERANKGGFEVKVAGQRAFCPISQIDAVRTTDPSVHEGRVYTFRIIEYKDGGKNIVVSRRAILEEEARSKAEEIRKSIVPGAVMTGRVVSVREYGAFVDLGGVQGLLHVSDMGWSRVTDPSEIVKPGDELTVKVLRVDEEKGKISLGLKQLQADPWSKVSGTYAVGQVRPGRIVRVQDFGAFVELEPGVEALAHVSTFPPTGTPDGWKKALLSGSTGLFEVLSVDAEKKRIGVATVDDASTRALTAASAGAASAPAPSGPVGRPIIVPGARLVGKVERHESFGVFVYLSPGRSGLMPASESGLSRGSDMKKSFPVGSDVEVIVLEVDAAGKRIRLSRKALLESEEKADARDYAERGARSESFGSIGDKLRAALEGRRR